MKKTAFIKRFLALWSLLVFLNPQLAVPLHFAFVSHDHDHQLTQKAQLTQTDSKCFYCDFHFLHFLPDTVFYNHQIIGLQVGKQQIFSYWNCSVLKVIRLYSGRAPPMAVLSAFTIPH